MENGQNDDLLEGLVNQTPVAKTEDAPIDLEISDSLGKFANRSNAFMHLSNALKILMQSKLV